MGRSLKIALFCCAALIMFAIVHSASHSSNTATAPQATPGPWSSVPQAPTAQSPAAQPPAVVVNNHAAEQTHYVWPDLSAPDPASTAQTAQADSQASGSPKPQETSASGSVGGSSDASSSIEPSVSTSSTGEPSSPDSAQSAPETASQRVARRLRGH